MSETTNQQLTINQPAAAPAASAKAPAEVIQADTSALAKVNKSLPRANAETIPSNWEINAGQEAETVECYNIRTGRTFTGSISDFNTEFFK